MATYSRGTSTNIIVGAAALFTYEGTTEFSDTTVPASVPGSSYKDTLTGTANFRNVGYTKNGLELIFTPTFGDVVVDQVLDVAKLYKKGMTVSLKTELVEATLANLLLSLSRPNTDAFVAQSTTTTATNSQNTLTYNSSFAGADLMNISAGNLGDIPFERGLVAVGPGTGDPTLTNSNSLERIYIAYRALSIEAVTIASKRDLESSFAVNFRMLPNNSGSYGKIVDRSIANPTVAYPGFPNS